MEIVLNFTLKNTAEFVFNILQHMILLMQIHWLLHVLSFEDHIKGNVKHKIIFLLLLSNFNNCFSLKSNNQRFKQTQNVNNNFSAYVTDVV